MAAGLDDVRRIALGLPREIDVIELEELLVDAWRMCVPPKVAAERDSGA